jgi:hypothetical protein
MPRDILQSAKRLAAAGLVVLLIAGCRVQSNVQSFSALPANYRGKTVAVLSMDKDKQGTLEFKTYAGMVEQRFRAQGFVPVALQDNPDYVAFLAYDVDKGQEVVRTYRVPQYGVTGYASAYTTGLVNVYGNTGTYSGVTTYQPQYGVTGYSTRSSSETIYTRTVAIRMIESANRQEAWSMQLSSPGACNLLRPVMDVMLDAAFSEFPNTQGRVTIDLESRRQC